MFPVLVCANHTVPCGILMRHTIPYGGFQYWMRNSRIAYSDTDTFPQKIEVDGSSLIINDFTGARISFIEQITQKGASSQFMSIPSPLEESFASDFALDGDHIWYTNWVFGGQGVLVSFNHKEYETKSVENPSFDEYIKAVDLPEKTQTPNGLTVDSNGFVWIADTSSSSLYQFDKQTESFTEYMTLPPPVSSYGNATGLVLSPVSRPYWLEAYGDLVIFNEQTGNRIGVLNPTESRLVEYAIPSANPNWADCGIALNCGLAQVFGFDISDQKVWFTEWVENNIGVLDLSLDLPIDIKFDPEEIKITKGDSVIITATISAIGDTAERVKISHNVPQEGIILEYGKDAFTVKENETVCVYSVFVKSSFVLDRVFSASTSLTAKSSRFSFIEPPVPGVSVLYRPMPTSMSSFGTLNFRTALVCPHMRILPHRQYQRRLSPCRFHQARFYPQKSKSRQSRFL